MKPQIATGKEYRNAPLWSPRASMSARRTSVLPSSTAVPSVASSPPNRALAACTSDWSGTALDAQSLRPPVAIIGSCRSVSPPIQPYTTSAVRSSTPIPVLTEARAARTDLHGCMQPDPLRARMPNPLPARTRPCRSAQGRDGRRHAPPRSAAHDLALSRLSLAGRGLHLRRGGGLITAGYPAPEFPFVVLSSH